MKYVSLFSGIEAASVAWEGLGWQPLAFSEIEPFACRVLEKHFPNVPNLGDITKIDWSGFLEKYPKPNIVVGGSPCQSFSIAGGRESLEGESGLMFEYVHAIRGIMPQFLVWENVPGCLSAKGLQGEKGGAFQCLLRELDALGYGLAWRVLDSQFFGLAQRRERVFLVGSLGDMRCAEVLFEPEGLRWDTPSSREKREELAARSEYSDTGVYANTLKLRHTGSPNIVGGSGTLVQHELSAMLGTGDDQTLIVMGDACAHASIDHDLCGTLKVGGEPPILADAKLPSVRKLTPVECERLQGFPDGWTDIKERIVRKKNGTWYAKPVDETPDAPRYRCLGNSMAVPVMRWIGKRIQEVEETI